MASTKISESKTAGEVSEELAKAGAGRIMTEYEFGSACGISFMIERNGVVLSFRLPLNWEGVLQSMLLDKTTPRHFCIEDQARRVAWRVILRWVQAQIALIESGSATLDQVFLPYLQTGDGKTVYQRFSENKFKLLGAS